MRPIPQAARDLYRVWLAMFPESRQHGTLDFFYAFTHAVMANARQPRDGRWLRELLERDAPALSKEAVEWYCERFDVVGDYEAATFKRSQVIQTYAIGRHEERRAQLLEQARRPPGGQMVVNEATLREKP